MQPIKPYFISCVLFLQRLLQEMTLEEHRELSTLLLERQLGLIFDALMMHQCRHGAPPFAGIPGVPWCTCGDCRAIQRDSQCHKALVDIVLNKRWLKDVHICIYLYILFLLSDRLQT